MSKFKAMFAPIILMGFAASSALATTCPGIRPTGGNQNPLPYPAITKIEFENPSAPSKPSPAAGKDRAQVTGGSLTKGKLIFLITLDRPVEAGCALQFDIFDDSLGSIRSLRGTSQIEHKSIASSIIPVRQRSDGGRYTDITMAVANGTNKVRVPVTIAPSKNVQPQVYRLKLTLDKPYNYHPVMPIVPFEFQLNPLKLVSIEKVGVSRGPNGTAVTELVTKLNEPIDPELVNYSLYSSRSTTYTQNASVCVKYKAISSGAGSFVNASPQRDGSIISLFDASYADRGNHAFYEVRSFQSTNISAQLVVGCTQPEAVNIGTDVTTSLGTQ